jgi:hypothetical protein
MEPTNASILVLKTGEQIICELKEVFDGEGDDRKGVCLLMIHPYVLSLVSAPDTAESQQDLQVKFSKWCPYAVDYQYKIPYDTVMAIGVPDAGLEQAYRAKVDIITQAMNQNAQLQQEEIENVINPEVMPNE